MVIGVYPYGIIYINRTSNVASTDDTVLNSSIILYVIVASYISFEPAVWHPVLKEIQTDVVHQLGILEKDKNNKGRRLKDSAHTILSPRSVSGNFASIIR